MNAAPDVGCDATGAYLPLYNIVPRISAGGMQVVLWHELSPMTKATSVDPDRLFCGNDARRSIISLLYT